MVPRPQQSAGLLVLPLNLPLVLTLVGEGVDALVAAGVAVRVVDDHVVRGDGQVDAQLVAGQAALGLGGDRGGSSRSHTAPRNKGNSKVTHPRCE